MKATTRGRWKIFGTCLLAAVAWQQAYGRAFVDRYFASTPPLWLRHVHFWMPDMLSTRLLNAFEFRFDIQRYHENTAFVLASVALEVLIWSLSFFGIAMLVKSSGRKRENVADAA